MGGKNIVNALFLLDFEYNLHIKIICGFLKEFLLKFMTHGTIISRMQNKMAFNAYKLLK